LRFREFHDTWTIYKVADITTKVGSGSTPKGGQEIYRNSGIVFIRSQNINNNKLDLSNITYIPESVNSKMKNSVVHANDLLLNITGASIGRSCVVPSDFKLGNVNQHVCIIRTKNNYSPHFLQYFLSSPKGQKSILQLETGSGREGLNFESVRAVKTYFPTHLEQVKIAKFLSTVDKKIIFLQKKKEYLETYKKGVMQAIFSRKICFKDKNEKYYPHWQEKKFGLIYSFLRTNSLSRAELCTSGEFKNIHYGDIHKRLSTNFDSNKEQIGFSTNQNGADLCTEGDLVIADASEDYKDIGKSIEIIRTNNDKVVAGLHTFLARPDSKLIAVGFSGYLMLSQLVRKQILRIATGVSVVGISKRELSSIIFPLPVKEEQQKIADFLISLDQKINLTDKELEQAREFKRAILEQMLV